MMLEGAAHIFGRDIDTDVIIPARYLTTHDQAVLGQHCFEDIDERFSEKVSPGDIVVAGENFGCGSSREHAAIALKGAGVGCVVAASFARIFFRNAINTGLFILQSPEAAAAIRSGDTIRIDTEKGTIEDLTTGEMFQAAAFPPFLQRIIEAGGLEAYARRQAAGDA